MSTTAAQTKVNWWNGGKSPSNLVKLKKFARTLHAIILRPYYAASGLYRVVNDDEGLQVDFMSAVHGVRSLSSLKSRAKEVTFGGTGLFVASLADIIVSKKAANRPRDRAVLEVLEKTLDEAQKNQNRKS